MQNLQTTKGRSRGWQPRTPLLTHQGEAVIKLLPSRVGALFMEMGTGKSRTAIELARLRQHKIDRVIWFCPVTLKPTVAYEISKHTDCGTEAVYAFDHKTREDTVPLDRFWYIVGIESMSSSARAIFSVSQLIDERTLVIVDESTYIKGVWAKRTQRITRLAEKARYRLILTGTPITQGLVDLYAQMRFLSVKILGYKSFYTFARNHLVYSTKNEGQIVHSCNVDWITERIQPYVYQVTKAECLTLPAKLFEHRYCLLSQTQLAAYQQAKEDFCEDLLKYDDGGDMQNGIAVFRLFSRLQAITCGFAGKTELEHNRMDLLLAVIGEIPDSHVVIWTKYQSSIDHIVAKLNAAGLNVWGFEGRIPEHRRPGVLEEWRQKGGYLVATQSLGGHGLDLTVAATSVFYSSGFKYSEHVQAEDRFHRIGQSRPVTYVNLWSDCGIEDLIRDSLAKKENALLRLRSEIDKVKKSGKNKLRAYVMSL